MARPAWEVQFQADGTDFRQDVNRNIQFQRRFNQTIGNASRSFRNFNTFQARATNLMRGFLAVAAGGGALSLGRGIVQMVDDVRILEGQLRAGTEELGNFYQAQDQIRALAESANQGLDILTRGYAQLALSADRATLSHNNILIILETFSNAARIGGSSADDLSEALRQMGQAAAEGRVQWEDLTIIMDRLVGIRATLNRYAQSRDTTLRTLTSTGFSFDDLLQALNQDRSRLAQSAGGAADTVSNSFTRLIASVRQAVAQLDGLLGITERIADGFDSLKESIENVDMERLAREAYAFFVSASNVLAPVAKLIGLLLETKTLLNILVVIIRSIDWILLVFVTRGIGSLIAGILRVYRATTIAIGRGLAITGLVRHVNAVFAGIFVTIGQIASLLGLDFWRDLPVPASARQSLFDLRIELRKLVDQLKRAKGEVGGPSGFSQLLREALLFEGRETPAQQADQDADKLLAERIEKMRRFLLQNKDLRQEVIENKKELRDILFIMDKWDQEAKVVTSEIERLEEALENADGTLEEGRIRSELEAMRERLVEANKEVAHLRTLLGDLFDAVVKNNLDNLEAAFKAIRQAIVDDIAAITKEIKGLKDELNNFVLSNDIRDAFEEVRDILSKPAPFFSSNDSLRIARIIREGRQELERNEEVAEREVFRRQNSVEQAKSELALAKRKQDLGEGNVQELIKEVKAKEELVKRQEEELKNAVELERLAEGRLKAYNETAKVILDESDDRGRRSQERKDRLELKYQGEASDEAERQRQAAEDKRRKEEEVNRLLQRQADLFQQIRQTLEQIGGNLLDNLLVKTQSWGDFLRDNLRLLAQFILRLTVIQPLADRLTRTLYPEGANALRFLSGLAVPVVIPGAGASAGSSVGGVASAVSPKSTVNLTMNISVDAVDARGVRRVMDSYSHKLAQDTANMIQGGQHFYT